VLGLVVGGGVGVELDEEEEQSSKRERERKFADKDLVERDDAKDEAGIHSFDLVGNHLETEYEVQLAVHRSRQRGTWHSRGTACGG
jgi:hypothetical protein